MRTLRFCVCTAVNILTYFAEKCKDNISSQVVLCNLGVNCPMIYIMLCWSFSAQLHVKVWLIASTGKWISEFGCTFTVRDKKTSQLLHCQTSQLYFAFHVFPPSAQNVFLPKTPSCFYPCRFPFLIHPFDHLKHQSITTRSCSLCLPAVRSLLSAFQWELLPAEPLPVFPNSRVCGRSEQVLHGGLP